MPTRDEAEQLVWPAIAEKITAALGEGDWRPSLNWLDVVELGGDGCQHIAHSVRAAAMDAPVRCSRERP